jgi:hypothetical protein
MDSQPPDPHIPPPARRRRRRWFAATVVVLLLTIAVVFIELPWILRQRSARRLLKARADAILAPASVEFDDILLRWFQPTEILGFSLRDKRGTPVLVAEEAVFHWSLWQILFARPKSATLSFPGGVLDVERFADGKINLYESLEPILRDKPEREIIITIDHGRLTFHDPAITVPFVAESADIRLVIAADPGPVTWSVTLAHGPIVDPHVDHDAAELARAAVTAPPGRIEVTGSHTRPTDDDSAEGDTTLAVKVSRWHGKLAVAGIAASGELDGTVDAGQKSGHSICSGTVTIRDLAACRTGDPPATGPVRLESLRLAWKVHGGPDLWIAPRIEVSAPLGAIAATRVLPDGKPAGKWLDGDLSLVLHATYAPPADRLAIGGFALATPYGRLGGSGTIDRVKTTPRLDMTGSLEPDWPQVQAMLVRDVEPNARIAGRSRGWTLAGPIDRAGDAPLDGLRGDLGIQLDALDVFGMRLGATALVVRAEGGQLSVDPIESRLNEGRLHVEPMWVRERDGSLRLKLGPSTTLENALINDEVSHRVLSYAAPVLDGATRVQGRVSVKRVDAEFPLFAADGAHARVEGDVLFDEVRFMPGPLADELMNLLPNVDEDQPLLTLRDPISLRITEGKVYQRGLKIPLTKLGAVALEGSVDFRKNLDLVARFSLNPPQAADKPVLASILKTARLEVPISGTLDDPRIDPQAMQERLKSVGSDLLENSVGIGAEGLVRFFQGLAARRQARLADPDRPQPMTPEERRNLREGRRRERLEKKAQRRLERGQPPE